MALGQGPADLRIGIADELLQHLPRRGLGTNDERGPHRLVPMAGQPGYGTGRAAGH